MLSFSYASVATCPTLDGVLNGLQVYVTQRWTRFGVSEKGSVIGLGMGLVQGKEVRTSVLFG